MKVLILNGPDDPNVKDGVMVRVDRWPGRKMRKVFKNTVIQVYPIWTAYTLAVLRQEGITPLFLDCMVENLNIDQTLHKIKQMQPDMVVIETSTPSIEIDLDTTKEIKEVTGLPTVLIDCHATYFHKELIKEWYVDFVVRGEFEMSVTHLAKTLRDKGNLHDVLGVTWKKPDGEVVVNPDRPLIGDLDSLPYPARDLVIQSKYRQELCHYKPYFQLFGSRGCPFHCIFCLWPGTLFKNKVRLRKVKKIVDEIVYLKEEYGAREVFLYDDTLNVSIQRVMDICNEILDRRVNIHWLCQLRPDKCSLEMFKLMKKSGCRLVVIGVESGSQELLDNSIDKKITLDEARNAVKWAKEAGITVHLTFVLGVPGETKETICQTYEFIKEVQPDAFQVSIATPYPGTRYYELIKNQPHQWKDFDGNCGASFCEGLTGEELITAINKMYLNYYFTPIKIFKRIFGMRSWDDIVANWELVKSFIGRYLVVGLPKKVI